MEAAAIHDRCASIALCSHFDFFSVDDPTAFHASSSSSHTFVHSFDLTKAPILYPEAIARLDASVWCAAMDRERLSLEEMGAFEEVDLPKGEQTIGLKWVFSHKTDSNGMVIWGKEKARLVTQGFN